MGVQWTCKYFQLNSNDVQCSLEGGGHVGFGSLASVALVTCMCFVLVFRPGMVWAVTVRLLHYLIQ